MISDDIDTETWLFLLPKMEREREIHHVLVEWMKAAYLDFGKSIELMTLSPFAARIATRLFMMALDMNRTINTAEYTAIILWNTEIGFHRIKKFANHIMQLNRLVAAFEFFLWLTEGAKKEISLLDIMDKENYEKLMGFICNSDTEKINSTND